MRAELEEDRRPQEVQDLLVVPGARRQRVDDASERIECGARSIRDAASSGMRGVSITGRQLALLKTNSAGFRPHVRCRFLCRDPTPGCGTPDTRNKGLNVGCVNAVKSAKLARKVDVCIYSQVSMVLQRTPSPNLRAVLILRKYTAFTKFQNCTKTCGTHQHTPVSLDSFHLLTSAAGADPSAQELEIRG